jgi:nicotinate-nucleotide pyrophosphorylase (carboxylating)
MRPAYITQSFLRQFIQSALAEDIGEGDHSSFASVPESAAGKARLQIKDEGILAGTELAGEIFKQFDSQLEVEFKRLDGEHVSNGDIAFFVKGRTRSILSTERLVLNCMQRMSGIATLVNRLSKLVDGTGAQLMDTRKTTPNFRLLEKWAVVTGGGLNHRLGLYDMIMLKDNHIKAAGGIETAINRAKEYLRTLRKNLKIEIEAGTLEQVDEVVRIGGVDVVMLDNMSVSDMLKAVKAIDGKFKTEASGGITEENIRQVARCGVDYVSVGALTHSVKSLDMCLKIFT